VIDLAILALAAGAIGAGVYFSQSKSAKTLPSVLVLSASDLHGGYFDARNQLCRLSPTPVEQISSMSGLHCVDETLNGLQLCELLTGGSVRFAAPDTGQPATIKSLQQLLDAHPDCSVVYLGCGMNDVLFGGRTLEQLLEDIEAALHIIVCAGRTPVLRGYHQFAPSHLMTAEKIGVSRMAGLAVQIKAKDFGVAFVDVATVPLGGMQADGLHPDADYHARLCAYQAGELLKIAASI
jgi:hypothetical protein